MTSPGEFLVRAALPRDRGAILRALREWSDRPGLEDLAPAPLLDTAQAASFLAEDGDGAVAGFVMALESDVAPGVGYIHFVWVSPQHRRRGLATQLYGRVFAELRARGCRRVEAVTATRNLDSIEYHRALGFRAQEGDVSDDRASAPAGAHRDRLPPGVRQVLLVRAL